MKTVAFLISSNMVEGRDGAREDIYEFHLEFDKLAPACHARGIRLDPVVWDEVDTPSGYDAVVIGPAWDYVEKHQQFLKTIKRFEAQMPVFNSSRVIEWNSSKTYLKDLANADLATIPTDWVESVTPDTIASAFERFGGDTLVAKPVVGASAWRQAMIRRDEPLPTQSSLPPGEAMLQPFLPSVKEEGEVSLLFFADRFSHAARKIPAASDYRVQSIFGGREECFSPSDRAIELGRKALRVAADRTDEDSLLYGRVDLIRGLDDQLCLIELELIEPYLYPEQGSGLGELFATALSEKLTTSARI